jgi:hypothetical protein
MIDVTTGLAFLTGLGLPEILLWVLTFAVVFEILMKLKILSRAPATLVSIAVGLFILLAVPGAVIAAIATMSTGMIVAAIGFLVVLALIEVGQIGPHGVVAQDEKGNKKFGRIHPFSAHSTIMTIVVLAIAALIFWVAGGFALIGITAFPAIGLGSWLLVVIGAAVLWMLSEAKE